MSAAYDYYPFGMQMPGRVVEDASVQCIPVTKYREVDKIVSNEDVMQTYDPGDQSSPKFAGSGSNTHVAYATQTGGGYKATLTSVNNNNLVLDASMTFRPLPSATTGLIVDVTVSENNFPDVTGVSRNAIGQGTLEVELRNLASGGIGTYLTTVFITGGGTGRMTVPPGMVAAGNVIRMWMHYVGPPPPWQLFVPNKRAQIIYTSVVSNIIKPADEQYVVLSCDTDGVYSPGYRYGFNGQEKTDELAGKGNHNTALYWEYDTRLGRRWNLDPIDQINVSNYAVNELNPILLNDPLGDKVRLHDEAKHDNKETRGVVKDQAQKIGNYSVIARYELKTDKNGRASYGALTGYQAFDKDGNVVYDLEPADLENFKQNVHAYQSAADMYNAGTEGQKKIGIGLLTGDASLVFSGIRQDNSEAWSKPAFVVQMIASAAHAGSNISSSGQLRTLAGSDLRAIRGLERQIASHKQKLANYIRNPDAYDNKALLQNISPVQRQELIRARINSLKTQINTFQRDIKAIESGTKQVTQRSTPNKK